MSDKDNVWVKCFHEKIIMQYIESNDTAHEEETFKKM